MSLEPCPFCGHVPHIDYDDADYKYGGGDLWLYHRANVVCLCGCVLHVENPSREYMPAEHALDFAIMAWNTRA